MLIKLNKFRRKKAAGTVQEEGANSSGNIKVKVKTRWGVKLGAPCRLEAHNRRGTYPNFTLLFHFSNKVTMTSVTWSKPTSWGDFTTSVRTY